MKKQNYKPQLVNQDNSYNPKNVVIIISIIVVVLVGFYFITTIVLNNKKIDEPVVESVIQTENIIFGQLLNRSQNEYYVLAYKEDGKFNDIYNNYLKKYREKENDFNVYKINLSDDFNKKFLKDNTNITDKIEELTISDETLFKIKDGKIDTYSVGYDDIIETLKQISE